MKWDLSVRSLWCLVEDVARTQASTAFIPHRFLTGLALYDLALFLTGLWNATDDGSIFLHCFTCSKWNHMLHRTASLLSVIGSTCTVKPRVKQSRHNRQPPTTPPPFFPLGLGCHILVQAKWQVTLHSLRAFIELTDLAIHVKFSSMGRLYRVSCEPFKALVLKFEWHLKVCWGRRPWHWVWHAMRTQASTVLFIRHGLWCLDVTGQGCRAELSPTLASLLFLPEQDCIRKECMIFINLISHVNWTCQRIQWYPGE